MKVSLGTIGFTWKGSYVSAATYNKNDIVEYSGTSYVVTSSSVAGSTPSPTNSNYDVFAEGSASVTGSTGDLVYNNNGSLTSLPSGSVGEVLKVGTDGRPEWGVSNRRSGMKVKSIMGQTLSYRKGFCLMTDGTMRAWGRGESWILGQGKNTHDRSYPINVAFPYGTPDIEKAHFTHNMSAWAIDADGDLWTWGSNDTGECGTGNTSDVYMPYNASASSANSIYGKNVIDVIRPGGTASYISFIALCSDGTVHSCGYNGYGQLGHGNTTQLTRFKQITTLSGITQLAAGAERYMHVMALKSTGQVYAWGHNNRGQVGQGDTTNRTSPNLLSSLSGISKIGAGGYSSWALKSDGTLYTWGYNGYGNLGDGSTTNRVSPVQVATGVADCIMSDRYESYNFTLIIKTDKSLWATGDNSYGCLGVAADATDRSSFTRCRTSSSAYLTNIEKVRIGGHGSYNFVIALDGDGRAWSVGYSGNGQLGRGTWDGTNYYYSQVRIHKHRIMDIGTFGQSSEGASMYLLENGSVMVAGYAGESQLPEDDDESASVPFQIIF